MSNIIPFQFETHAVRVHLDAAGNPWFAATDVAQALAYRMASDMTRHLEDDEKGTQIVRTPGGDQEILVINEPGLYSSILKSRKPEAKRFKRWVTHDVLPALRKTGHYAMAGNAPALPTHAQDTVGALLLIGEAVAKMPGVKRGIAMAATLTCIHENTGLALETLRRALPANDELICALNATQLGKLIARSAKATNQHLAAYGFQIRNDRDEWELTDTGSDWAEALPFSRNGHSGYQILWNPAVAEQLREVA